MLSQDTGEDGERAGLLSLQRNLLSPEINGAGNGPHALRQAFLCRTSLKTFFGGHGVFWRTMSVPLRSWGFREWSCRLTKPSFASIYFPGAASPQSTSFLTHVAFRSALYHIMTIFSSQFSCHRKHNTMKSADSPSLHMIQLLATLLMLQIDSMIRTRLRLPRTPSIQV